MSLSMLGHLSRWSVRALLILAVVACVRPEDVDETIFVRRSSTHLADSLADTIKVRVYPSAQRVIIRYILLINDAGSVISTDEIILSFPQFRADSQSGGAVQSSSCHVYSSTRWRCSDVKRLSSTDDLHAEHWIVHNDTAEHRSKTQLASAVNGPLLADSVSRIYVKLSRSQRITAWVRRAIR